MPRSILVGKTILIGLTYYEADGTFSEQKQAFGRITNFRRGQWIVVQLDDGEIFELPPDRSAIQPASPGEYRLRSTGQIVTNPDYLCSYTVTKPVKH